MSTYWIFVDHTKRERIDPFYVGGGAITMGPIINGDAARLLTFVMMNRWQGDHVTIEADGDLGRLAAFEKWPEVSGQVISDFVLRGFGVIEPCTKHIPADPALR